VQRLAAVTASCSSSATTRGPSRLHHQHRAGGRDRPGPSRDPGLSDAASPGVQARALRRSRRPRAEPTPGAWLSKDATPRRSCATPGWGSDISARSSATAPARVVADQAVRGSPACLLVAQGAESPRIPAKPVTHLGIQALVPETERNSGRFRANPRTTEPPHMQGFRNDGARGTRTPDLLGAIQALSQLSYSPGWIADCSRRAHRTVVDAMRTDTRAWVRCGAGDV
jgi:hypothetical protein